MYAAHTCISPIQFGHSGYFYFDARIKNELGVNRRFKKKHSVIKSFDFIFLLFWQFICPAGLYSFKMDVV